jgi:2-iminobutanoate/2-iminopropanoate deaminase
LTKKKFSGIIKKIKITIEELNMDVVQTSAAPAAIGPYSQAFVTGNLVFTSGQIPLSPGAGEVVGSAVAEQTEQVIKNLGAVLEAAGSSLAKVIKTTCFLADMNDFAAFNEVYAKYFTGKPARSTVAVRQLPKSVLVEIEAIAEI